MPDFELSLGTLALLMSAALVGGFVDAIAGGGGLVTLPAILATGLPPHVALGTNKGQGVFGSGSALASYAWSGRVDRKRAPGAFLAGLLGSFGGALLVLLLDPAFLRPVVLVLLAGVAIFLAVRPPLGGGQRPPRFVGTPAILVGLGLAFVIGAYDGFFGPGTGTFLIIGYALLLGAPLTAASADAKVVNFASNVAALTVFALKGVVVWKISLPMAAAQFTGGWLGAQVAVRGGDRFVRWVVLAVVLALVAKLSWELVG